MGLVVCAAFGCNDDVDEKGLVAGSGELAVVSDNYTGAVSVSLLDTEGAESKPDWVGSRTKNTKLRSPLSDDVVLPTVSTDSRYLTTLERGLSVITRFDIADGSVLGQLRTDESSADDTAAYHSNPQDVLDVSDDSSWVSRWRQNADAEAAEAERGNDLIEWNPKTWKRTDRRIDLSSLNQEIDEEPFGKDGNSTGTVKATAYASPTSLVPVGKYVAVGITGITLSYNYGPGKLVIADLKSGKRVSTLDLEGFTNCGEVKPVVGDDKSVLVACLGAYGDDGSHAGILRVSLDDSGKAKIGHSFRKADHEDAANANSNVTSLGGDIVVAVAAGALDPTTKKPSKQDKLLRVDLASGEQTELWESKGAFSLGTPAFVESSGLLLVPDAGGLDEPLTGVQRFKVNKDREADRVDFVDVAADSGLAARRALAL